MLTLLLATLAVVIIHVVATHAEAKRNAHGSTLYAVEDFTEPSTFALSVRMPGRPAVTTLASTLIDVYGSVMHS